MATAVSVVIETDSVHDYDDITFADCLAAVARQTYPPALVQVVVVIRRMLDPVSPRLQRIRDWTSTAGPPLLDPYGWYTRVGRR